MTSAPVPVADLALEHADDDATRVTPDLLKRISEMTSRVRQIEREVARREDELAVLDRERRQLIGGPALEGALPAALEEAGIATLSLTDGTRISVKETLVPPSVAARGKYRAAVLAWLNATGHGDVIKRVVQVPLARGNSALAEVVRRELDRLKVAFTENETVEPQTLAALLRELLEAGEEVPLEELGVQVFRQAKIEVPKTDRAAP